MGDGGPDKVAAVVLAGGRGTRLGGVEKGLVVLAGRPLIAHVLARILPQASPVAISANTALELYAAFGLPVLRDPVAGWPGPLAGVLAGFGWLATVAPAVEWLLTVPCDAPILPNDLVVRLAAAAPGAEVVCASSGGREHPVCALWHRSLCSALARDLAAGQGAVGRWAATRRRVVVDFACGGTDPFLNVNDPAGLAEAARLLG